MSSLAQIKHKLPEYVSHLGVRLGINEAFLPSPTFWALLSSKRVLLPASHAATCSAPEPLLSFAGGRRGFSGCNSLVPDPSLAAFWKTGCCSGKSGKGIGSLSPSISSRSVY